MVTTTPKKPTKTCNSNSFIKISPYKIHTMYDMYQYCIEFEIVSKLKMYMSSDHENSCFFCAEYIKEQVTQDLFDTESAIAFLAYYNKYFSKEVSFLLKIRSQDWSKIIRVVYRREWLKAMMDGD